MNNPAFPSIPRIESLHHRLKTAKDADGQPLLDQLMVFLEAPPPGTTDRWQDGAELCAKNGLATSRVAVWRFYRAHILQWRREQSPSVESIPAETTRLLDQARHLTALRTVESLHDPSLPPGILVGLVHGENRRQELLLARDHFTDKVKVRERQERINQFQRIDNEAREEAFRPYQMTMMHNFILNLFKAMHPEGDYPEPRSFLTPKPETTPSPAEGSPRSPSASPVSLLPGSRHTPCDAPLLPSAGAIAFLPHPALISEFPQRFQPSKQP